MKTPNDPTVKYEVRVDMRCVYYIVPAHLVSRIAQLLDEGDMDFGVLHAIDPQDRPCICIYVQDKGRYAAFLQECIQAAIAADKRASARAARRRRMKPEVAHVS